MTMKTKLKQINQMKKFFFTMLYLCALAISGKAQYNSNGPQIKAMEGVSCKIIRTETVLKTNCVECGFNDLSMPKQGFFKRETLQCEEWRNGNRLRSWTDTKDTFLYCHEPYRK
jgi:hypothetical protein